MVHSGKHWLCIIFGLIVGTLSIIPLLNYLNVIEFNLPFAVGRTVLAFIMAIAGLWLVTLVHHEYGNIKTASLGVGLVLLAAGIISILYAFNVIGFGLDFIPNLILNGILAIAALLLIAAGFHP